MLVAPERRISSLVRTEMAAGVLNAAGGLLGDGGDLDLREFLEAQLLERGFIRLARRGCLRSAETKREPPEYQEDSA